MLPHLFLEQQAERCITLAYQCQNKNAERFLRLLAVDLMLAAQLRRPRGPAASDELSELDNLSRQATTATPAAPAKPGAPVTPESASTA